MQVRPRYVEGPLVAWRETTDSTKQREMNSEIAADSVADLQRGRENPLAFFPSARARLVRNGRNELLDSLRASGLRGAELEGAFQRAVGDATLQSSIFAHEGRHAIDDATGAGGSTADKEFRAKLSEVAFAPRPRLTLGGIISETIGDQTPHGKANERVMKGLLAWMQLHAAEITNLDAKAALLPQLPLLTDDQLRAAFRSMDPLAGG